MAKSNSSYLPPAGSYKKDSMKVDFGCNEPADVGGPDGPHAKGLGETKPSGARASRVNGLPGGPYKADGEDSVSYGPAAGAPNKKSNKGGY